jgi:hypothetical protein
MHSAAKKDSLDQVQIVQILSSAFNNTVLSLIAGISTSSLSSVPAIHLPVLQIEFTSASLLSGSSSKVFLGASVVHFGDSPPQPGQQPNRAPPATAAAMDSMQQQPSGSQPQYQEQAVEQEFKREASPEPAASTDISPVDGDVVMTAAAPPKAEAAETAKEQQQSLDPAGDDADPSLEQQHSQQLGRAGSKRQAALAASATWAPTGKRRVSSADAAKRALADAAAEDRDSPAPAELPAAAAGAAVAVDAAAAGNAAPKPRGRPRKEKPQRSQAAVAEEAAALEVAAAAAARRPVNRRKRSSSKDAEAGGDGLEGEAGAAELPLEAGAHSTKFK